MTLTEYLDAPGAPTIEALSEASDVSKVTIGRVYRGMRLRLWDVANRLSKATGGLVTVAELCE